ncbi:MAG: FAD-dependent oxidoreductase [Acidobacteria bacterium]|nr:MAG: FAD-dependent oxidoreductase [Acidobacteriota bacterium]REK03819.1 MAG: FAD-dependent oxidoreductase [Acidobacteriota bacterium]
MVQNYVRRGARGTAVVGAGLAGVTAARTLADHGLDVVVFEKSRGPGGRMARRSYGAHQFDFGAQYFTVRDPRTRERLPRWIRDGVVAEWPLRLASLRLDGQRPQGLSGLELLQPSEPRFVATPGMTALCKHVANGLELRRRRRVVGLDRTDAGWMVISEATTNGEHSTDEMRVDGPFQHLVLALPAEQAAQLLDLAPDLRSHAAAVCHQPCWAVMLGVAEPLDLPFDGAFVDAGPLRWVARDSSKPGRPSAESWVLHAGPEWSSAHFDDDPADVCRALIETFEHVAGRSTGDPGRFRDKDATELAAGRPPVAAHRWRYSMADDPLDGGSLWDEQLRLGLCGDWCAGSRVEGAFLSGLSIATAILTAVRRSDAP